jgi:S-adenosylmethionine decarboxylase proenzyme
MPALCQHTLIELNGCDPRLLKRSVTIKKLLCRAVLLGHGTIVKAVFHNFNPHGVSGVVVITESHVTIHTWPEYGYAAVDIFSCNPRLSHRVIRDELKRSLAATKVSQKSFRRGLGLRRKV